MVLEDYLPLRPLGSGATGIVFLVRSKQNPDELFAIKAFDINSSHETSLRAQNEERILTKIRECSPLAFLPNLHSSFAQWDYRFLVLDFCAGGNLNSVRHSQPDKRLSPEAIRFYAAEIVVALLQLHDRGIVFRDLKPENVLLTSSGHITLTDFDLSTALDRRVGLLHAANGQVAPSDRNMARKPRGPHACFLMRPRRRGATRATHAIAPATSSSLATSSTTASSSSSLLPNSFVGTEEYVAPEMIRGSGHDFAVDWWALGVVLYELLYGATPFRGPTRRETFCNITRREARMLGIATPLKDLIRGLLAKDPARRLGGHSVAQHEFFSGLRWDELGSVCRPPFVPYSATTVPSPSADFDVKKHLAQVEFRRAEERARRKVAEFKERASKEGR